LVEKWKQLRTFQDKEVLKGFSQVWFLWAAIQVLAILWIRFWHSSAEVLGVRTVMDAVTQ